MPRDRSEKQRLQRLLLPSGQRRRARHHEMEGAVLQVDWVRLAIDRGQAQLAAEIEIVRLRFDQHAGPVPRLDRANDRQPLLVRRVRGRGLVGLDEDLRTVEIPLRLFLLLELFQLLLGLLRSFSVASARPGQSDQRDNAKQDHRELRARRGSVPNSAHVESHQCLSPSPECKPCPPPRQTCALSLPPRSSDANNRRRPPSRRDLSISPPALAWLAKGI